MEARNRAIANRSRANSPNPQNRHRRDRSSGPGGVGHHERFPISTAMTPDRGPDSATRRGSGGRSLEVPGDSPSSIVASPPDDQGPSLTEPTNGVPSATTDPTSKRDSRGNPNPVGRFPLRKPPPANPTAASGVTGSGGRVAGMIANMNSSAIDKPGNRDSAGSLGAGIEGERRGVILEDKPMDD